MASTATQSVTANVPFAFKVGQAQLPAGSYEIQVGYQSLIVSGKGKTMKSAYSQAHRDSPRNESSRVFHHVGSQYFLAEIWRGAATAAMTIPASKLEKELEMASGLSTTGGEVAISPPADGRLTQTKSRHRRPGSSFSASSGPGIASPLLLASHSVGSGGRPGWRSGEAELGNSAEARRQAQTALALASERDEGVGQPVTAATCATASMPGPAPASRGQGENLGW